MSVVRDYYKLKKFNVLEVASESRRDAREDGEMGPASQNLGDRGVGG